MKEIFQFWAQICFLATPLARCPLAVVQRNDPNLSTSASVALPMSRTTCCTPPYPCSWSMGLCVQLCRPMCSYDRISRRDDPFSLWTIKCPMIVNRGWKSAKMGDKWTHQCSFGNQCSFRGCCELGEWLVIGEGSNASFSGKQQDGEIRGIQCILESNWCPTKTHSGERSHTFLRLHLNT